MILIKNVQTVLMLTRRVDEHYPMSRPKRKTHLIFVLFLQHSRRKALSLLPLACHGIDAPLSGSFQATMEGFRASLVEWKVIYECI